MGLETISVYGFILIEVTLDIECIPFNGLLLFLGKSSIFIMTHRPMFSLASATCLAFSPLPLAHFRAATLAFLRLLSPFLPQSLETRCLLCCEVSSPTMWRSRLDCHFLREVSPGSTPPILDLTSFPVMYTCDIICALLFYHTFHHIGGCVIAV